MSRAAKIRQAIIGQQHAAQVTMASRVCLDRAKSDRLKGDAKTQAVYRGRAIKLQQQAAFEYDHVRRLLGIEP